LAIFRLGELATRIENSVFSGHPYDEDFKELNIIYTSLPLGYQTQLKSVIDAVSKFIGKYGKGK
jgi:hypothetical protein